ncbi:penicillin-binding protein, beta-lactamase class C [Rivularia sp. PCC 7116]|uniref:serine hydrolase n=1 Tax=Rivularia sp. PCC 7116 TaxID=373994 RepID=UPI00029F4B38|nr:serine hydrolase [Rivularia sp. PCC 7116]AFY57836.1 penicillin-binding protein, beta-lactamase class C [Rivularia sp. PCC 7116]
MLDFNSEESNVLIAQDIGSALLGLTPNPANDTLLPQSVLGSSLQLSPQSDETQVLRGTKDFDFLRGQNSDDTLYGLAGNDFLSGGKGNDTVNGGTDKDWLLGAKGNDVLIDGDGGDFITGGEGADIFWINNWDTPDTPTTVLDFKIGEDTIKIGRLGVTFDSLTFEDDFFSTTILDNGKPLAKLIGIDKNSLTPQSFIFGDAALVNQLQTKLEKSVTDFEIPGATQAVVTPDGFTWKGAAGFSNLEAQTPMETDDVFSIASITKAFTGATVLKVVESGKISLDDTLGKRLPEIAKNFPDGESITLRQLINGSRGIPSFNSTEKFLADLEAGTFADKSPEEIVAYVYGEPLFTGFQSTPIWAYTNTGDIIAALMVEQATGKSFAQLMQDKVIEPLGLDDTFYGIPEKIPENLVRSYTDLFDASGKLAPDGTLEDITELDVKNISAFGASAALFSDADDVARFNQALLGGELLGKDSLNELVNFVDTGSADGTRYGLGIVEQVPDPDIFPWGREWSLRGNSFGQNSFSLYLPDRGGYINTVLANRQYPLQILRNSAELIIGLSLEVSFDDFSLEQLPMQAAI